MDAVERARALDSEGTRLIEVVVNDLDADVPTCPGWQAADLLAHVAGGWEAFRAIAAAGSLEPPDFGSFAETPESRGELVGFAVDRLAALVETLGGAEADQPTWTWVGVRTMAFWQRRAHLEAVVHRVDAELAAGARTPVDPAVGVDAVDELYTELLSGRADGLPTGSLHLHQIDGDGEFMLDVIDGRLHVAHEHAKGDAALRAGGEDLMLVMWGRRGLDGLELFGDPDVARQWVGLAP